MYEEGGQYGATVMYVNYHQTGPVSSWKGCGQLSTSSTKVLAFLVLYPILSHWFHWIFKTWVKLWKFIQNHSWQKFSNSLSELFQPIYPTVWSGLRTLLVRM